MRSKYVALHSKPFYETTILEVTTHYDVDTNQLRVVKEMCLRSLRFCPGSPKYISKF